MAEVTVRVGKPSEVVSAERRLAVEDLARRLGEIRSDADLVIIPRTHAGGAIWYEVVSIYIGASVANTVVPALASDLYEVVKRWASERFQRKSRVNGNSRPEHFSIYGPDGDVLKSWTIDKSGEEDEGPAGE